MVGDLASTEHTIDVYIHQGASIVHRQVEVRNGKVFMRLKKRPLSRILGI